MYKVGDRVKIKNLREGTNKYDVYITPDMEDMYGQIQTITKVEQHAFGDKNFTVYKITNSRRWWTDEEFVRSAIMV